MEKIITIGITESQRRGLLDAFTVVERDFKGWLSFDHKPEITYRSAVVLKEKLSKPDILLPPETPIKPYESESWPYPVIWWDVPEHELICLISVLHEIYYEISFYANEYYWPDHFDPPEYLYEANFYADNYEANADFEDTYNKYCSTARDIHEFENYLYKRLCNWAVEFMKDQQAQS